MLAIEKRRLPLPGWLLFAPALFLAYWTPYLPVHFPEVQTPLIPLVWFIQVLGAIFFAACGIGLFRDRLTLPLPCPSRQSRLESRLRRVLVVKMEVERVLDGIPDESPHKVALESRLRELESSEQCIRAEMSYKALADLDKRAGRVVHAELKQ